MLDQQSRAGLDKAVQARLRDINTCIPGRIVKFDPQKLTCTVQIDFVDYFRSDGPEPIRHDWQPIPDVPVIFTNCGGGFGDTFPLVKDDPVLVLFAQRSTQKWYAGDGKTEIAAPMLETHAAGDALVIAGLFASGAEKPEAHKNKRIIGHKDGKVRLALDKNGPADLTTSRLNIGDPNAGSALAKGPTTDNNLTLVQTKLDAVCAIFGIPPIGALPSTGSSKAYTNDT